MKKSNPLFKILLLLIYGAIVAFALIYVVGKGMNLKVAVVFEIIGFVLLLKAVLQNHVFKKMSAALYVPLFTITLVYTACLDILNLGMQSRLNVFTFTLSNVGLLAIYLIISMPMYSLGTKGKAVEDEEKGE